MTADLISNLSPANFADRLSAAVKLKKSVLIAGIDPRPEIIPESLMTALRDSTSPVDSTGERQDKTDARVLYLAMRKFCFETIDAVADYVCAIKIQVAFFEQLGPAGWRHCGDIIQYARNKGLIVISDAKRGDIGTTSDAYARAWLASETPAGVGNLLQSDAVTVAPYLGRDTYSSFEPYIKLGAGTFILCRTSNKSAIDIQDLECGGMKVWEHAAKLISEWGANHVGNAGLSSVGAVAGATYPEEGARIREIAPNTILLIPGVGAQGGRPEDARRFTRQDGTGAVFNVSRGIMYAYRDREFEKFGDAGFAEAARESAKSYRDALWEHCKISD